MGYYREAESPDAPERGGLPRSSDEGSVMVLERRGQVIAVELGQTGMPGGALLFSGRRQPSCDGMSRMMREYHVWCWRDSGRGRDVAETTFVTRSGHQGPLTRLLFSA